MPTQSPEPALPWPAYVRRLLLAAALLLLLVALLYFLSFAFHALLLGFAGLLLAVFLYTPSERLAAWTGLPYTLALTITSLSLLALLAGSVWLIGARVSSQVDALQQQLPESFHALETYLRGFAWGPWLLERLADASRQAQQQGLLGPGLAVLTSLSTVLAETFIVLFIGFFGALDPQLYVRGLLRLVPLPHRPLARAACQTLASVLWWWLLGQLAAMAFIGVATGLTVWALGLHLVLTLALLAALLNFIPNFGPLAAAIPAALLALLQGPMTVLWVLIAYILIQFLQNHLVTPLIQQRTARLPPILLILAQIILYYSEGLLGMALAPPLAASALALVDLLYVRHTLGDPMTQGRGFWPDGATPPA